MNLGKCFFTEESALVPFQSEDVLFPLTNRLNQFVLQCELMHKQQNFTMQQYVLRG